jgi:hypothetical protein
MSGWLFKKLTFWLMQLLISSFRYERLRSLAMYSA